MADDDAEWINLDRDFSGDGWKLLLDQYKLFVDTSSRVSDRRGTANTFLMSVNTALVTVFGLIAGKDASLAAEQGPWRWLLPLAGISTCLAWVALIRSYRSLNKAKFAVILDLERLLPARLFDREWEYLKQGRAVRHLELTWVEQLVPIIFGAIYLVLLVAAVAPLPL